MTFSNQTFRVLLDNVGMGAQPQKLEPESQMIYRVETKATPQGTIEQDIILEASADLHRTILSQVLNTNDEHVKKALRDLGWFHGKDQAFLEVPNAQSEFEKFASLAPQKTHRVTIVDVEKMEKQIRRIADALHL